MTTPLEGEPDRASATWLVRFCKRYEGKWRGNPKKNRTRSIVLLMNKADKEDPETVANKKQAYQKIIDAELRDARGRFINEIAIMPCSVVTNSKGTSLVDGVIAHLAKAFKRS